MLTPYALSLALCPTVALGIHLVERRGRVEKLNPRRQIEIGTLLESMPEAVFLFDSSGRVLDLNSVARELADIRGDSHHQLDAATLTRQFSIENGFADFPAGVVEQALRGEIIKHVRRGFRDPKDGHTVEALVSATPMRAPGGEIVGALVMIRDITETAQLQRRLAETQKHYAVGQMAAGIAHDFNNVLEAIAQAVFILQAHAEKPVDERRSYLRMIERAVRRGSEISRRVREYLKNESSERTPVDIKCVVEDSIDLTRSLWSQSPNLQVTWEIDQVPPAFANGADLRRVFTNLIINAIEAMPQGGCIHIKAMRDDRNVVVSVSDTGPGIAPEHRKRIFSPYFTTKREGTGLGLSGAHKIITALNGNLSFTTEVGKGTTFKVELPIAPPDAHTDKHVHHRSEAGDDGRKPAPNVGIAEQHEQVSPPKRKRPTHDASGATVRRS